MTFIFSESEGALFVKNFKLLQHSLGRSTGGKPSSIHIKSAENFLTPIRFFGIHSTFAIREMQAGPQGTKKREPKLPLLFQTTRNQSVVVLMSISSSETPFSIASLNHFGRRPDPDQVPSP